MEFLIKSVIVNIPLKEASMSIISHNTYELIECFERKASYLNMGITLKFKILYTSMEKRKLSIYKYNFYTYQEVFLNEKINGIFSCYIDFKPFCTVLNSKIISNDNNGIKILVLVRIGWKCSVEPSIIYVIKDEHNLEYLYSSDKNFKNLKQINFTPKLFNNLCFSNYNNGFMYLNSDEINNYSFTEARESILFKKQGIIWFYILKKGKILWLCNEKDNFSVYYNEELIYKSLDIVTYIVLLAAGDKFCVLTNKKMMIINLNGDVLFNESLIFSRIVINNEENFGVGAFEERLFLINLFTKEVKALKCDFDLKWFIFYSSNELLILGKERDNSIIGLLNIFSNEFNILLKEESEISSIEVNDKKEIFYTSNILGLFNVYKLINLKTPKLMLKLFSKNLKIIFRK